MDFDASKQAMINVLNHEIDSLQKKIKTLEAKLHKMEDNKCEQCAIPSRIEHDDTQLRLF